MSNLFAPLTLRGITFPNRAWMSPMCMFSSRDGVPNEWHQVHLGSRAVGGAGLVMTESTAVSPVGRISSRDTGIWNDDQARAWSNIASFVASQGAVPGIQLSHAGRKGSVGVPWEEGDVSIEMDRGGWQTVSPSAVAFGQLRVPQQLTVHGIHEIVHQFRTAASRAQRAGFVVAEIHAAHGYLVHQFLSPVSNTRSDHYGGSLENRSRLLLEIVDAVREEWPDRQPLFVRLSATDWTGSDWTLEEASKVAQLLPDHGVDLIDVSSGGNVPRPEIPAGPGYQVSLARVIREVSQLPVSAVGLILDAAQAEQVLTEGSADAIMIGRGYLSDPYWAAHAAATLGSQSAWPPQYLAARI